MATAIWYAVLGFFGLIGAVIVLGLLFGKRIEKKWEYEAEFRDEKGRELGEFEIELFRIPKEQTDFTLKARFVLRHPALEPGRSVEVRLADELVMQGAVETAGRIRLREQHLTDEIKSPAAGQVVSVRCGGLELFAEELRRD